jgi:uncharacterized delta-60 repeat protein
MKSIISFLFIIISFRLMAQNPGSLDLNFNASGYIISPVIVNGVHGASGAGGLVVLKDNSVVMVGSTYITPQRYFSILKYLDNGELDSSFGNNGVALIDVGWGDDYASCISTDKDNKFVVGGYSFNGEYNDFGIIRLNSDGSIDKTFGDSGKVIVPTGKSDSYINDITVLSDNSIVVVGKAFMTDNYDFTIYKLLSNGKPDTSFGNNGLVSYNFGTSFDEATKVQVLENEKLIVGGISYNGQNNDITIALLTNTGQLDTTFNHTGYNTWDYQGKTNTFSDMTVAPSGSVYLTGYTTIPGLYAPYVAKFTKNGVIDSTFATKGVLTYSIGEINAYGISISVDNNRDVYAIGYSQIWGQDIFAVKFNSTGTLDSNFGTEGIWSSNFGSDVTSKYCTALGIKSNGKIIIGGTFDNDGNKFLLIQLNNDETSNNLNVRHLSNEVEIFPNPANDLLNLKLGKNQTVNIQIINTDGKTVYANKNFSTNSIDVSGWKNGVYVVYVKSGEDFSVQKVIIQ